MIKFVSNLFDPVRAARTPSPSEKRTRLDLEALEDRFVPAVVNLTGHTIDFAGGQAQLRIQQENPNGAFVGVFQDFKTGLTAVVQGAISDSGKTDTGKLMPNGTPIDNIWFMGVGASSHGVMDVQFNGQSDGWGSKVPGFANTTGHDDAGYVQGAFTEWSVGSPFGGYYSSFYSMGFYGKP
jgi:hypothetical protein